MGGMYRHLTFYFLIAQVQVRGDLQKMKEWEAWICFAGLGWLGWLGLAWQGEEHVELGPAWPHCGTWPSVERSYGTRRT